MAKHSWYESLQSQETKSKGEDICTATRTSSHPQADLAALKINCACTSGERWIGVIAKSSWAQLNKRLIIHAFTSIVNMSPQLKLQKISYLKGRVVVCYVGVVVPGGRLGEEQHLLCSAVVVKEKPLCIWQRIWIVCWLPFFSQRLRERQHLQQHKDCPEKPVHSPC